MSIIYLLYFEKTKKLPSITSGHLHKSWNSLNELYQLINTHKLGNIHSFLETTGRNNCDDWHVFFFCVFEDEFVLIEILLFRHHKATLIDDSTVGELLVCNSFDFFYFIFGYILVKLNQVIGVERIVGVNGHVEFLVLVILIDFVLQIKI